MLAAVVKTGSGRVPDASAPPLRLCGGLGACDDGNPCTDDTCDPTHGCTHAPNTALCDAGDACAVGGTCRLGACVPRGVRTCDDGNPCTDDACDPAQGCVHSSNTGTCDDGDACTVGDACAGGTCTPRGERRCDDGNPCTDDACDKAVGCVATSVTGRACDDGDLCTLGDTCVIGRCVAGADAPECDDGDPCTDDGCAPATGCVVIRNVCCGNLGVACPTGFECTGDEDSAWGAWCENRPIGQVHVPAGGFWMGCVEAKDGTCWSNETYQHYEHTDAYQMDTTAVTVAQYAAFLNSLQADGLHNECPPVPGWDVDCPAYQFGCPGPEDMTPCYEESTARNAIDPLVFDDPTPGWAPAPGQDMTPMGNVRFEGASAYCAWVGKRLCTEPEWEKAARGTCGAHGYADDDPACADGMPVYPWGDAAPDCEHVSNWKASQGVFPCGEVSLQLVDVASYPKGRSPMGVLGMSGVVMEWVGSPYADETFGGAPLMVDYPWPTPSHWTATIRGSTYFSPVFDHRISRRDWDWRDHVHWFLGFRCCSDAPP